MEKGKLGIRLSFYAVAAFILAFLGYSTVLALLTGFVLIVEKNEWASRQVIQAFFLCIFADIVNGILNIFDFLYQIPLMGSVWGTAISVIDGIVSLVVLIFCIMALVNTAKGNEANVPGLNGLANWAYGIVAPKVNQAQQAYYGQQQFKGQQQFNGQAQQFNGQAQQFNGQAQQFNGQQQYQQPEQQNPNQPQ